MRTWEFKDMDAFEIAFRSQKLSSRREPEARQAKRTMLISQIQEWPGHIQTSSSEQGYRVWRNQSMNALVFISFVPNEHLPSLLIGGAGREQGLSNFSNHHCIGLCKFSGWILTASLTLLGRMCNGKIRENEINEMAFPTARFRETLQNFFIKEQADSLLCRE